MLEYLSGDINVCWIPFTSSDCIYPANFAGHKDLNKDPNVWLDGARPPPKSLIMSSANS